MIRAFGFNVAELTVDLFLKEDQVIRMGVPPVRIELLTTISGVKFDDCYAGRIVDDLDGIAVNIISLQHLKINKQASGRHQDLADLENLP